MARWKFMTSHSHVLACIAADPKTRLRDIAAETDLTERYVHQIVGDLVEAGYVKSERHGARNRYEVHLGLPLRDRSAEEHSVKELLGLLVKEEALNGNGRAKPRSAKRGRERSSPKLSSR